jgi:excisionase family DNA binding protein
MRDDSLFSELDQRQKLSVQALAKLSGFSKREIYTAIRKGRIPGVKRDGKSGRWKIPRDGAEQWWANLERPAQLTTK